MTKAFAFAPIRNVYKVREVAANSWFIYMHTLGFNGELSQTARVVFFGNSREQVDQWLDTKEEKVFIVSEY